MEIGRICGIYRYPVKSMAGEKISSTPLDWHGIVGDRRFAFRRLADNSGFPWLTASRFPRMILYQPLIRNFDDSGNNIPTHVRTPDKRELELESESLRFEIESFYNSKVALMQNIHGIFDEESVSIISVATLRKIEQEYGKPLDLRRFRPNIVVETERDEPFEEQQWIGQTLCFGDGAGSSPSIAVTQPDKRCVMINLDPETAQSDDNVMKTVIKLNRNVAGVYGAVTKIGKLTVNDKLYL